MYAITRINPSAEKPGGEKTCPFGGTVRYYGAQATTPIPS